MTSHKQGKIEILIRAAPEPTDQEPRNRIHELRPIPSIVDGSDVQSYGGAIPSPDRPSDGESRSSTITGDGSMRFWLLASAWTPLTIGIPLLMDAEIQLRLR
jgi:hypothetical protein